MAYSVLGKNLGQEGDFSDEEMAVRYDKENGKTYIIQCLTIKESFVIATFFSSYVIKSKQNSVLFPESQIYHQSADILLNWYIEHFNATFLLQKLKLLLINL